MLRIVRQRIAAARVVVSRVALLSLALFATHSALAQIDPTGEWGPRFDEDRVERFAGADIGEHLGYPVSAAGQLRTESWDAALMELPENQCRAHSSDYGWRGPSNLRIWKEVDKASQKLIAYHTHLSAYGAEQTIWMDGRPHPPQYARHTWAGFSTGHWEGDTLVVETTHLKENWLGLNGVPRSDQAHATAHIMRHGDILTVAAITYDPVYLTEPLIRTTDFVYNPQGQMAPWPCESVNETDRPVGVVPHHLPGQNPFLDEFPAKSGIPPEATRAGAETAYPEYRLKLKTLKSTGMSAVQSAAAAGKALPAVAAAAPTRAAGSVPPHDYSKDEVHLVKVQGNIYMLVGAGGNITVQVADDGVLLVDTGLAPMSDKVIAAIRSLTDRPLRYIINTHLHADHTGGNEKVAKSGMTIAGGNVVSDIGASAANQAQIIAFQRVLDRMSATQGQQRATAQGSWPTEAFTTPERKIYFNGEGIRIIHIPDAHTDGDSLVFFRKSDVISTGDLFVTNRYPIVDLAHGGNIQGVIAGLNKIIEIAIPADLQEDGTLIIPGHGRLCDVADVVFYQEMVTIIRDRVQDMVGKGMTLEQVEAAKPTRDYDPRYGATTGIWTTDQFVAAVYKSLSRKKEDGP